MKQFAFAAIAASLFAAGAAHAQVTIEWITVGNPGNAPDPTVRSDGSSGYGSVAYEYRIARYEVTNSQYAAFLNSVAASDPNFLYHPAMAILVPGGIVRSGSDGSYTYSVKPDMGNKPVAYVSWYGAARFCNWLTNGQPSDGGTESGVYTFDGVHSISAITRDFSNSNQVFLPTENEWYKAAYHQPAAQGGDSDDYWLYATRSNDVPTRAIATSNGDIANPGANVVNYSAGADWNGLNGNVTTIGSAGPDSVSFYGTFDQGGNLWEWCETPDGDSYRILLGGSYREFRSVLQSWFRYSNPAAGKTIYDGFRLASPVPPCLGDWDGSGGPPDSSDFLAYLNDYSAQDPAADLAPPGNPPGDGSFDSSDFLAFLNLYAQGC